MISQGCRGILKVWNLPCFHSCLKSVTWGLSVGMTPEPCYVCVCECVWLCVYTRLCVYVSHSHPHLLQSSFTCHLRKTFWNTTLKVRALFHPHTSCLQVLPCGFWVPRGQLWLRAFPAAPPRLGCENNRTHIPTSPLPDPTSVVRLPAVHLIHSLIHSSCHAFALERDRNLLRPSSVENEVSRQKEIHLPLVFHSIFKIFLGWK